MDKRPIGVFDSGLGGLTAVRELKKVLPNESILYFGDTGRVPYGTKSPEIINKYAGQDMNFLLSKNVKVLVAACGTVSSAAREALESSPVPQINVIDPTAEAAAAATKNGKIGIIATAATVSSNSYKKILTKLNHDLEIFQEACPLLVSLVESGFVDPEDKVTRLVLERYLDFMIKSGVDTLIMGCTHYPIISRNIAAVMGSGVKLIDSGKEAARECAKILAEKNLLADTVADYRYFVSDSVKSFCEIAELFLGEKIGNEVERIDIEKY